MNFQNTKAKKESIDIAQEYTEKIKRQRQLNSQLS